MARTSPVISWGRAQLHVQLDVAFEILHGVLVDHLAVGVFEHVLFEKAPPVGCKIEVIQVLNDLNLIEKAAECQFLGDAGRTSPAAGQRPQSCPRL